MPPITSTDFRLQIPVQRAKVVHLAVPAQFRSVRPVYPTGGEAGSCRDTSSGSDVSPKPNEIAAIGSSYGPIVLETSKVTSSLRYGQHGPEPPDLSQCWPL